MTIQITKVRDKLKQDKLYQITLNMKYLDGETILIDQDFTQEHRSGDAPSICINKFKTSMQKAIDDYKAEQVIFTSPVLDTAITSLQNSLTT